MKLSPAMIRELKNLWNDRPAGAGLEGRSAMGGLTQTMWALGQRGLVSFHPPGYGLTDLGRSKCQELFT